MRIVITGSQGQLGLELQKQLKKSKNIQLYPLSSGELDIVNKKQVEETLYRLNPEVVINCAAYTAVDLCEEEQEKGYNVNVIGPYHLAIVCKEIGTKLVHVSTDYVFSGMFNLERSYSIQEGNILEVRQRMAKDSRPWREDDPTNPQSIYGLTKWQGEEEVRKWCSKYFIIRTAWLYGEGNNFVRTMLKLAETNKELNVVGDQFGNPTYAKDLAIAIVNLMQTEYYGTYHGTCEGTCSWYDFAKKIFEIKGINIKVNPVTSEEFPRPAKRPFYSSLDNFMLKIHGMNTFRTWEEALEDYLSNEKIGVE